MFGNQRYASAPLLVLAGAILFCAAFLPAFASAKEDELSATIRAVLMSDPNSASLSEAEINALTAALAAEAEDEGVTAGDIVWRPEEMVTEEDIKAYECGNLPAFLCSLNKAFGFSGNDLTIPVSFFVSSMVLLLLLAALISHYRHHLLRPASSPASPTPPSGV